MKRPSLRLILILGGMAITLIPLILITIIAWYQGTALAKSTRADIEKQAQADLDHTVVLFAEMSSLVVGELDSNLMQSLTTARQLSEEGSGLTIDPVETIEWQAIDQYSKRVVNVSLPRFNYQGQWLGQSTSLSEKVPLVDLTKDYTGAACTIFQRMNAQGDMLRVATNIEKLDGTRAIGTYIPARNPDGQANPVVSTLLQGDTYTGRAFVVNQWYVTVYEPIRDNSGNVTGALFVGLPMTEAMASLRDVILDTKVGDTGYVYVLNAKGKDAGRYVISYQGKRDGENILDARDASGHAFIREIVETAPTLGPHETATIQYPWQNDGDPEPRMKVANYAYMPEWDWVIAAGSYENEFYAAAIRAEEGKQALINYIAFTALGAGVIAFIIAWRFGSGVSRSIERISSVLNENADFSASAAQQVSQSASSVAEGGSRQAAAVEETSASLEELAGVTRTNAEHSAAMLEASRAANEAAQRGNNEMGSMQKAMGAIQESSDDIKRIVGEIDALAFQTNILALNAAVEAARAGEAGAGFSVVAEEVRNLAHRSANAARETAKRIGESIARGDEAARGTATMAEVLREIGTRMATVDELGAQIATAAEEQRNGIDQANRAMSEIDQVTQSAAAAAQQGASAAEELHSQVECLRGATNDLNVLVLGTAQSARNVETPALNGNFTQKPNAKDPSREPAGFLH